MKVIHGEILTEPAAFDAVVTALKTAGVATQMAEVTSPASTYTKLEGTAASQMVRLLETLEDQDDVQNVYLELRYGRQTAGRNRRLGPANASFLETSGEPNDF